MNRVLLSGLAAAAIGSVAAIPANAFPVALGATVGAGPAQIEKVQYRHFRGRHYGRHGWYRGHRHHGYGAGVGAGIAGLAAGAIIGGAIANSQAPAYYGVAPSPGGDAVAYCEQRFKSYDPASGTYLGYDGDRHPCP